MGVKKEKLKLVNSDFNDLLGEVGSGETLTHSRYSPSGYYRWSECLGHLNLVDAHPEIKDESSAHADEGTVAHDRASYFLKNGKWHEDTPLAMKVALEPYILFCLDKMKSPGAEWFIEQRLELPGADMWGTADFIAYLPETKQLHVVDLKYGKGVGVEAVNNSQLKIYGLMAMMALHGKVVSEVHLTIVQPRYDHYDGPIRTDVVTALSIAGFGNDVRRAIEATKAASAPVVAGEWCKWCKVASVCPTLQSKALATTQAEFSVVESFDPIKLSQAMKMIPALEGWIKAVKARAFTEAMAGNVPEGFKFVEKKTNRQWRDVESLPTILGIDFGVSELEMFKPKELLSPAQMEKLLNPDQRKELAAYIEKPRGHVTLAKVEDKRAAVTVGPGIEFDEIKNEEND